MGEDWECDRWGFHTGVQVGVGGDMPSLHVAYLLEERRRQVAHAHLARRGHLVGRQRVRLEIEENHPVVTYGKSGRETCGEEWQVRDLP